MSKERPNILLLVSDQHTYNISGYAGESTVNTPNLDSIAENGMSFNNAYCQSPVCTPSRMSFLTGKYISNISCWNNHWVLPPEHMTMADHFFNAGYETCLVGKMHFGGKDQFHGFKHRPYGDLKHGLGHQPDPINMFPTSGGVIHARASEIPESLQQEQVVTTEAESFILEHEANNPDQPWFVCASYCKPHAPLVVPSRYLKRYVGKVPSVKLERDDTAAMHPYPLNQRKNYGLEEVSQEEVDFARAAYWGAVDFLDDCIGRLLDKLRENGSLDNTIIVYISDHGDLIGNHGLWWKANYYEEALRVPFLISGPGLPKGISRNDLVGLIDLFPTLCSLTGTESKCDFDGLDLSPRLCTPSDNEKILRNYIMSEFYGMAIISRKIDNDWEKGSAMRTIISDKFKYVNIIDGNDIMFDLKKDPREFTNVIDDPQYAEEAKGLKAILNKDFSWDKTIERIKKDNERALKLMSGVKPSTPNQYMLPDGRIFDAEESLYNARWLKTDLYGASGIIPQKFG